MFAPELLAAMASGCWAIGALFSANAASQMGAFAFTRWRLFFAMCLLWKVKESLGRQFRFVELANDVNEHMPDYTVSRLVLGLNERMKSVKGSRILLVGLAYKKNSSDARESPAIRVAQLLSELGAILEVIDPFLEQTPRGLAGVSLVQDSDIAEGKYDAAVILTDHDDIDYASIVAKVPYIFDSRHRLAAASNVEFL